MRAGETGNTLIIGSALGLLVNVFNLQVPDMVMEPFRILGGAGVPLILAAFGMSLRGSKVLDTPPTNASKPCLPLALRTF